MSGLFKHLCRRRDRETLGTTAISHSRAQLLPIYQPLNSSRSEIRLLKIAPSVDGKTICKMKSVSLDDHPLYIALSYTWGDQNVTRDIIFAGRDYPVTENLWYALKHISIEDFGYGSLAPHLLFWIDALCINQRDNKEKSNQVQLMQRIYSNAMFVSSWLGTMEAGTLEGLEAMEIISASTQSKTGYLYDIDWFQEYPELWKEDLGSGTKIKSWNAIIALMKRDYWSRIWIIQELFYAKMVKYVVGSRSIDHLTMERVLTLMSKIWSGGVPRPNFFDPVVWESIAREGRLARNILDIMSGYGTLGDPKKLHARYFLNTISHKASDPRDKIYAVPGFAESGLVSDYDVSVRDLYIEVAIRRMDQYGILDVLRYSGVGYRDENEFRLPSWVPDWHGIANRETEALRFRADGEVQESRFSEHQMASSSQLVLTGNIVTTITRVEKQMEVGDEEFFQFCVDFVRNVNITEHSSSSGPNSSHPIRVLSALFVGDDIQHRNSSVLTPWQLLEGFILLILPPKAWTNNTVEDVVEHLKLLDDHWFAIEGIPGNLEIVGKYLFSKGRPISRRIDLHDGRGRWDPGRVELTLGPLFDKKLFRTAMGHVGKGSVGLSEGDSVFRVNGCASLVVLRKDIHSKNWLYVGTCTAVGLDRKREYESGIVIEELVVN